MSEYGRWVQAAAPGAERVFPVHNVSGSLREGYGMLYDDQASWGMLPGGRFPGPLEKRTRGAELPPIRSGFPAFATRSDRARSHGKSGRSCSPS